MRRIVGWIALGALLVVGAVACRQIVRSPIDRVGGLLWEMTEIGTAARDGILTSRGTEREKQAMLRSAARGLAERRHRLAELVPSLDPATELATRLERFVEAWPTEEAFSRDLLDTSARGSRSASEIAGLAGLVPDTRPQWKTPFRIFRP